MQIKAETTRTCPKCNGRMERFLGHWQCKTTRCQHKEPAYDLPPILVGLVPEKVAKPDPLLCPVCKRVLQEWGFLEDDYPYYCDLCDESYNAALEKEPVEPKALPAETVKQTLFKCRNCDTQGFYPDAENATGWTCPLCKRHYEYGTPKEPHCWSCNTALEYDKEVRDGFPYWCEACNLWHNTNGDPQPGSYVRVQIPHTSTIRVQQLEAVAAAAVAVFTRHGKELVWMPGSKTRNDLQHAVVQLLASGWRPAK